MRVRTLAMLLLTAAVCASGCGKKPEPPQPVVSQQQRAQALIDSGNVAYRDGDYAAAAKRFAAAAVVSPEDPAAFYGLGMALAKLGRDDDARVAYAKARELSRGEVQPDEMPREVKYRRTLHP